MPDDSLSHNLTARVVSSIEQIGRDAWNGCVPSGKGYNPFVDFDFLHILEESGCVSERTGWGPCHIQLLNGDGVTLGVMPLYVKTHSQGEYVFDHSWADAYKRAGGHYYPKLQCAVPFSPVTGPRLLVIPGEGADQLKAGLLRAAVDLCGQIGASGVHMTFPGEQDWALAGQAGLLLRQDQQFHWSNAGFADFEAFLAALSANRRKTIRRERRDAQAGIEIVALSGADLTEAHWDAFFGFYMDTGARKWGRPYLNRLFFSLLTERMADKVLLVMARREGRWIAGALNLIGGDCLFGRNWGCTEDRPFLHFELCYYQAIEQAIRLGLGRVEAGAQGQHKIARGYLPSPVYSAHWIHDPGLREPIRRYLDAERPAVEQDMQWLEQSYSPFRNPDPTKEQA